LIAARSSAVNASARFLVAVLFLADFCLSFI
jgi:hypothetical protein